MISMANIYFSTLAIFLVLISLGQTTDDWKAVDEAVEQAILNKAFPGAVISVGNSTHVIFQKAYGHLTYSSDVYGIPILNDTKYDVASVTKVMATTLAIMNLASSKSINLDDLVSKYIQNYDTNKKGNTTIKNLLLHNAGLPYDYPGALPQTQEDVIDYIRFIKPVYPIGSKFSYSNLGFLLLGKIVESITKKSFDEYCKQNRIFAGLKDTGFNPPESDFWRTAPTQFDTQTRKRIVRGEAHERLAYFFNGIAGHSGYFTTASDLLRYMRTLLNLGKLPDQVRTLPESAVTPFIKRVHVDQYENTRGYGFDTACPCSKMSTCFGHDGSTGVSGWVESDKNISFVIMSNRGHPDVKNNLYFQTYKQKLCDAIMTVLGY